MDTTHQRLQDIDRELEALGEAPDRLPELIAHYAGTVSELDEVDETLWELQQGMNLEETAPVPVRAKSSERPEPEADVTIEQQPEPQGDSALDEASLFGERDRESQGFQEEPVLEDDSRQSAVEAQDEAEPNLELDIDPSVFPASIAPEAPISLSPEAEAPAAETPYQAAGQDELDAQEEPDIDELDEDFLALLDEDIVEMEED